MNKSWILTIGTVIIAIAMIVLPVFGVEGISESMVTNIVYMALGIGTIGAGNKVRKVITKKNTPKPQHQEKLTPQLKGTWYKTNMRTDNIINGNVLDYGEPYLYAQITNTKSYTTAKLSREGKLIQIDQSAVGEPVRLEMFERKDGQSIPMPVGTYTLQITGDSGTSDSTSVTDEFEIV